VDEVILGLLPDQLPDIRGFFQSPWEPFCATAGMFLDGANEVYEGYDPYFFPRVLSDQAAARVRDFDPDASPILSCTPGTAFWSGQVQVGPGGKTEVTFPAPGHAARWRIVARAISGVDRFGWTEAHLVTVGEESR